jgi:hypothetical protein
VRTSPRIKRKPTRYEVSVVTRDEVGAYKPYLWEQSVFDKGPMFREWLLTKIVNGERASYSAPKFARMQERTRSQMLEDIGANLQNHAETGQIPKPYRRGASTFSIFFIHDVHLTLSDANSPSLLRLRPDKSHKIPVHRRRPDRLS